MASLDPERGLVVVRIVYDGPPRAGKTTSLTALGRSLGRQVACAGEEEGRTLWFDWMDYVGGLFEGRPIRCQVVTVPGQPELWPRRRALLETADVVVFVADSREERLGAGLASLESLRALLPSLAPPAPAVILQANKRDVPDAAPLEDVRSRLAAGGGLVAVTESIAHEGLGIRETFVLAVRLALDRVRELVRRGKLPEGRPEIDSAEDLLAALRATVPEGGPEWPFAAPAPARRAAAMPGEPPPEPGAPAEPESLAAAGAEIEPGSDPGADLVSASDPDSDSDPKADPARRGPSAPPAPTAEPVPRPPDPAVPGGMIWPPVGGRVILHEAAPDPARLRRLGGGGWADFGNPRWLIHSHGDSRFESLEEGRLRLVEWARWHTLLAPRLSSRRSVVLGEAAPGVWRLWQIVGRQETLSAELAAAFAAREPEPIADALAGAGEALAALHGEPGLRRLRPGIDSVGFENGRPVYLGRMPPLPPGGDLGTMVPPASGIAAETGGGSPLRDLGHLIAEELARWPGGRAPLLAALGRRSRRSPAAAAVWRLVVSTPAQPAPSTGTRLDKNAKQG